MTKPKHRKQQAKASSHRQNAMLKWMVIIVVVLISAGLFYWVRFGKPKSASSPQKTEATVENAALLEKANLLTQEVFRYVELVETKKMTQEEANRLSSPVKVELQNIRMQLSQRQLAENDSIRKAYGDIMVANVMKWRQENLPPVKEE